MPFMDQAALATHDHFRLRIQIAMVRVAVNVAMEAPDPDARKAQLRKDLATNTLNNPDAHVNRWSWALASQDNITYASADTALQTAITNGWNAMAGV